MSGLTDEKLFHLCFDPAEFRDEEDFNPAAFLVEKRKYVSIDMIIKDLVTFREYLQDEVVHLVNTDVYDTFLSVTNKLYQREGELLRLQAPLPELGARVKAACGKLEDSKNKVGEKLQRIHHLEKCKMYSVRKLKITVVEHGLKGQLEELEKTKRGMDTLCDDEPHKGLNGHASDANGHANGVGSNQTPAPFQNEARLKLMSSIAQQARRLQVEQSLWVAVLDEQKTDRANTNTRLNQFRMHILEQIQSEYVAYLTAYKKYCSTTNPDLLASILEGIKVCLEAYHELEEEDAAVNIFRDIICTPSAEDSISWAAARGSRDSPGTMNKLFEAPIEACRTKWKRLIDVGHEAGITVLVVALWQSFSDTISKRLHFLFDSGNPYLFNHRYRAAHKLAVTFENCCPTIDTLQKLRQEMKLWESRWNTDVYYKMREITVKNHLQAWLPTEGKATLALATSLNSDSSGAPDAVSLMQEDFSYGPCAATYSLLMWCGSDMVMMYPLGHKFMRLCIEVAGSLKNWHNKFLSDNELPVLDETGDVVKGKFVPSYQLLAECEDDDVLLNIHLDLSKLKTHLNTTFGPAFKEHYISAGPTVTGVLDTCLDAIGMATTHVARDVTTALTAAVTLRCINLLGFVAITPSNLFAKKTIPTSPSAASAGVLQPLNMFKPKLYEKSYPQEVIDAWSTEIITVTTTKYRSLVQDTRVKAKQQQASLSNWRNKKESITGAEQNTTPVTQANKCDVQFYLDVLNFGKMLSEGHDIDIDTFGPYQRLLDVVRRGAWLHGSIPDEPVEEWLTTSASS